MSHLLTGSEDGYIRDYDIFIALNGKTFLSAPQRHHAGVVEGLMKAGQLYCWWENPAEKTLNGLMSADDDMGVAPVYSLAMHSDALWALSGSDVREQTSELDFFFFFLIWSILADWTH
jgi:transcriptional activator SPT8